MVDLRSLTPWASRSTPARSSDVADPFSSFRREMDRLFDDFFTGRAVPGLEAGIVAVNPRIDVNETDKELVVTAELPGVDPKDVDLELTGDLLTLKGDKKAEQETRESGRHVVERSYGSFTRSIRLPFEVESDKAKASFDKGVLTVTLPKPESARKSSRKIEVKAA